MASEKKLTIVAFAALIASLLSIVGTFVVPSVAIGSYLGDIRNNTAHRIEWRVVDPQAIKCMPERLARIETNQAMLMNYFGLQPKKGDQ